MTTILAATRLLFVLALAGAHLQSEVQVVPSVNLERYTGRWFEIARYPNRFQRDCTGNVRATYTSRPDGRLDVLNECMTAGNGLDEAKGVARVVDTATSAKLAGAVRAGDPLLDPGGLG